MRSLIGMVMKWSAGSVAALLVLGCGGPTDDASVSPEPLASAPPPPPPGYDDGASHGPNPCGSVVYGEGEHMVDIPILCAPVEYDTTPEPDDIHEKPTTVTPLWGDV